MPVGRPCLSLADRKLRQASDLSHLVTHGAKYRNLTYRILLVRIDGMMNEGCRRTSPDISGVPGVASTEERRVDMTDETLRRKIEELEKSGWQADTAPRALEQRRRFRDFYGTLCFLMEVGAAAERSGAMPSITIEGGPGGGIEVRLRVGGPRLPGMTAEQVELAGAVAGVFARRSPSRRENEAGASSVVGRRPGPRRSIVAERADVRAAEGAGSAGVPPAGPTASRWAARFRAAAEFLGVSASDLGELRAVARMSLVRRSSPATAVGASRRLRGGDRCGRGAACRAGRRPTTGAIRRLCQPSPNGCASPETDRTVAEKTWVAKDTWMVYSRWASSQAEASARNLAMGCPA